MSDSDVTVNERLDAIEAAIRKLYPCAELLGPPAEILPDSGDPTEEGEEESGEESGEESE